MISLSLEIDDTDNSAQWKAIVQNALSDGAIKYIQGCESRIAGFVREHYCFKGALKIHAQAIGWDIVRVPLNIIWSVANILLALVGLLAGLLRLRRLQAWIRRIPPGLETDMDRQISWLVVTELLQLPYQQGDRRSDKDALMEEIVRDPQLQELFNKKLDNFKGASKDAQFYNDLEEKLAEYGATRTGSADLASNAALLIGSKITLGQASLGSISAGTTVSATIANSVAASNFWLGSTMGSYYYAMFPVAVSARFLIAVTTAIAVLLAFISTFIGILTDPLQARLGLHQRRLRKLIASIGDDLLGKKGSKFALREKYVGRIFDLVDLLSTVGRSI